VVDLLVNKHDEFGVDIDQKDDLGYSPLLYGKNGIIFSMLKRLRLRS